MSVIGVGLVCLGLSLFALMWLCTNNSGGAARVRVYTKEYMEQFDKVC